MKTFVMLLALLACLFSGCEKCEECTVRTRVYLEVQDPTADPSDFGVEFDTNTTSTDEYCDDDLEEIKESEGTDVGFSLPGFFTQYIERSVDCK